ncbi:MAG TPA: carotenoid oxygenase family protein [Sphingobium sp.]|nr:carotenoid oxygenase family protein [Sphingobium sp.]
MVERFPTTDVANGFFDAARFEADLIDCEVIGQIPAEISGTFYRLGGDWLYPPRFADDSPFNADGYISMFRIMDGSVDYKGRFVDTERYRAQRAARRQRFGRYRNPRGDDPDTGVINRTVANTTPFVFGGKLFALKEDSLPLVIDPDTLETLGAWDFDGTYSSPTFTAHPKIDPVTGEMICMAYEAEGEASNAVHVYGIGRAGRVNWRGDLAMPYVSMLHDFAITPNHIILPVYGLVTGRERLEVGEVHWGWDGRLPSHVAIIPRGGTPAAVRWFTGPPCAMVHVLNAVEQDGHITLDALVSDGNPFPFFPAVDGSGWDPMAARTTIRRLRFDLRGEGRTWSEEIVFPDAPGTLGRIDDRFASLPYRYAFMAYADSTQCFDTARAGAAPALFSNSYACFDLHERTLRSFFAGSVGALQECCFVPRHADAPEGDGFLIGVYSDFAERRSELLILDAQRLDAGPLARVVMPFRLSSQVHGVWAPAGAIY